MNATAILLSGRDQRPSVVRLDPGEGGLSVIAGDGSAEKIAWWRLYRISDEGTTHRFQRLDKRHWELRATSGSDRALLSHIGPRPIARILHPLRRLHLLKTVAGLLVIAVAVVEHLPPKWVASWITPAMERRLVEGPIADLAVVRCSHHGGEEAVRKLLTRLDPVTAPSIGIVGINSPEFFVTALPANKLAITRQALQSTDPEMMAALLAHQISHLKHGDAIVAAVRNAGALGIWGAIVEGGGSGVQLIYSGIEERRADLEAIAMMKRAGIPIAPAAEMFEEMRIATAQGTGFAYEYRDFHFGTDARAQRWAAAAAEQSGEMTPALPRDDADALFNFCWEGRLPPVQLRELKPAVMRRPGVGTIQSGQPNSN